MSKLLGVMILLFSVVVFAVVEKKEFSPNDLKVLAIKSTMGKVDVVGSSSKKVKVIANKTDFDEKKCKLSFENKSGEFEVKVEKMSDEAVVGNCELDLKVEVPNEVALDLKHGLGDVNIQGNYNEVELKLGRGNTLFSGHVKDLEVKTGSGEIEVNGRPEEAEIMTGMGNIKVTYLSAPLKGSLDVKTGTGDALVVLPENSKVKASFKSGLGELVNEFPNDKSAEFTVSMKSGMGDLNLKKSK